MEKGASIMTNHQALASITQTAMRHIWNMGDKPSVGDIARSVARCATIMQFMNDDDRIECENKAIIEIARRYKY